MEIEVRFYSGYMGDETPRAIVSGEKEYPVERVLSRKRCSDKETRARFDLFLCLVSGRKVLIRKAAIGKAEILPASDLSFVLP